MYMLTCTGVLAPDDIRIACVPSIVNQVRSKRDEAGVCINVVFSNPEELTTHRGDLIRRAFWHCSIMETYVANMALLLL